MKSLNKWKIYINEFVRSYLDLKYVPHCQDLNEEPYMIDLYEKKSCRKNDSFLFPLQTMIQRDLLTSYMGIIS